MNSANVYTFRSLILNTPFSTDEDVLKVVGDFILRAVDNEECCDDDTWDLLVDFVDEEEAVVVGFVGLPAPVNGANCNRSNTLSIYTSTKEMDRAKSIVDALVSAVSNNICMERGTMPYCEPFLVSPVMV